MHKHNIKLKLLHPDARIPSYATDGSGAFDFFAPEPFSVEGGESVVVPLGLAVEVPEDYTLLLFSRSGHGFKHDLRLSNCVGVIDSDYRGEVKVKLRSDARDEGFVNTVDKAVAQGALFHTPRVSFSVVQELSDTKRGASGFGSTG